MRVCTLLLMQPAPLTGTATFHNGAAFSRHRMQPAPLTGTATLPPQMAFHHNKDAARTPHGDSNQTPLASLFIHNDAARTPHGDSNAAVPTATFFQCFLMQPVPLTGTTTLAQCAFSACNRRCSPCPSRGQQPSLHLLHPELAADAARTPHGDSNFLHLPIFAIRIDAARTPHGDSNQHNDYMSFGLVRCSPHLSRGQQHIFDNIILLCIVGCSPHPSRGQKRRRHTRFCVTPSFLLSRGGLKPL